MSVLYHNRKDAGGVRWETGEMDDHGMERLVVTWLGIVSGGGKERHM